MVKINPENFDEQVREFFQASDEACQHPKSKAEERAREKGKLWFETKLKTDYWIITEIQGIENPDEFDIQISLRFRRWEAIKIARAIILHKEFRKSGDYLIRGTSFSLKRKFNSYTVTKSRQRKLRERRKK